MSAYATYDSLSAAARGLLVEAVAIASSSDDEFAVCGGWSPVLRNSAKVPHPGTRDVDLLFSEGATRESLKGVVSAFLDSGYMLSAKHEFQVLRTLDVCGTAFVFNVDLLHPREGDVTGHLFVDHLSLPIRHEDFRSIYVFVKSIALANAGFVFDGFIAEELVESVRPDGVTVTQQVPVIDEVGLIVTKCKSCLLLKRPRDIFDIYLAISSPRNQDEFIRQLQRLRARHESAFAALECIREGVDTWERKFGEPAVFAECGVDFRVAAKVIRTFVDELDIGKMPGVTVVEQAR